jgi:precorrin-2 dehydrogenase/sirohydrochlorin ferrochelatase
MKLPTVLKLDGPVVIFGGGQVGLRKVEYISKFSKDIILVTDNSPEVPDHVTVKNISITIEDIPDLIPDNSELVIAALSDTELNHAIAAYCRKQRILINVVDDIEPSSVLFPALSHAGDLNIAISTSGKCPYFARKIREEVDDWLPEKERWLQVLAPIRDLLVGNDNKNEILSKIYHDPEISKLITAGDLENAIIKSKEIYNVYRQS